MLRVEDLAVEAGGLRILSGVDLRVETGEVVAILGPSGSGKSTLLRAIAGLADVVSGDILWDDRSVLDVPAHRRGFGLMFQRYALFPHLDVAGNVAFGLKMKRVSDIDRMVAEALDWVGLAGFQQRDVESLSGGESQRVALARTIAPDPQLVMLDEPLGALDRDLRQRLLTQIKQILAGRQVTALVVTHDREEAVALSSRLALMRDGTIVQSGTVDEILSDPADEWVSSFLG
jgi:thiamine transport system ATP-binding protein